MKQKALIMCAAYLIFGCTGGINGGIKKGREAVTGEPEFILKNYANALSKKYLSCSQEGDAGAKANDQNQDTPNLECFGIYKIRKEFDAVIGSGDLTAAKKIRDDAIRDLLLISDNQFSETKRLIYVTRTGFDAGSRLYNLLFSSISTVSTVTSVKTGFAAAATFENGATAIVNDEFYAKQTKAIIVSKMEGSRAEIKLQILNKMQQSASDFTYNEAVDLVDRYNKAGSMVSALIDLEMTTHIETTRKIKDVLNKEVGQPDTKSQPAEK